MIYLSAQPDSTYFLWQLELQIFNFSKLGIRPESIVVLIAYHPAKGLSPDFKMLVKNNKQASFFTYPDTRISKQYESSIRPHIIAKHFSKFPNLSYEVIFYHDSDIILRKIPDFFHLMKDKKWYVSDTRKYLDSAYIIKS